MVPAKQIADLSNMRSDKYLISSLYLRLWPDSRIHRSTVKDMIREKREELKKNVSQEERERIEEDFAKLRGYAESVRETAHKGLAVFAGAPLGLWQVFPLSQPVRDLLVVDRSPYMRPLVSVLDVHGRSCTLLVDRTKARIFEIFAGEIEEHSDIYGEVPSRVREGGFAGFGKGLIPRGRGSERQIERHVAKHLHDHLKRVAETTFAFLQKWGFDRLFLGGQADILAEMEEVLHPFLKQRMKGAFRIDLIAPPHEVLKKTLALEKEVKEKEDRLLVSRLANSLGPTGLGVTGLYETLSSLHEGAAHTLLVEEGFAQPGVICPRDKFLGTDPGPCPLCRTPMEPVPDVVDWAVASAFEGDCKVAVIRPEAGLKEMGSIGALLRYKPAVEKKPGVGPREQSAEA